MRYAIITSNMEDELGPEMVHSIHSDEAVAYRLCNRLGRCYPNAYVDVIPVEDLAAVAPRWSAKDKQEARERLRDLRQTEKS